MIIHVFGKMQGPTSTGDLHEEYFISYSNCISSHNYTWSFDSNKHILSFFLSFFV